MSLMRATVKKAASIKVFDPLCRPFVVVYGRGHARQTLPARLTRLGPHRDHTENAAPTGDRYHYPCTDCRVAKLLDRKGERERQMSADEDPEDDWVYVEVSDAMKTQFQEVHVALGQAQETRAREMTRGITKADLADIKGDILWDDKGVRFRWVKKGS